MENKTTTIRVSIQEAERVKRMKEMTNIRSTPILIKLALDSYQHSKDFARKCLKLD